MSDTLSATLTSAVNVYIEAPTGAHRDNLILAADEYRELWINVRAAREPASKKRSSHPTPTVYRRKFEDMQFVEGIPVTLALQEREKRGEQHWVLSWRTRYSPGGPNRRFYDLENGIWTIPAAIALELFEKMKVRGGLDFEEYPDPRLLHHEIEVSVSTELTSAKKEEALAQLTRPDEKFGSDPFFVTVSDPKPTVTKAMIVDTDTDTVTFRSITEDPEYMPKKNLNRGPGRWLDNTMLDANVQQMTKFYENLRGYLGRK